MNNCVRLIGKIVLASGIMLSVYIAHDAVKYYVIPYMQGYRGDINMGAHTLHVKRGWLPAHINRKYDSATVARFGILSDLMPGFVDVQIIGQPDPDYLKTVLKHSDVYKKYPWGTARRLRNTYFTEFLEFSKAPEAKHASYYIVELNAIIDAYPPENINSIISISKSNAG